MLGIDRVILFEALFSKHFLKRGRRALLILFLSWIIGKRIYMRIVARMHRRFPFYSASYLSKKTKQYIEQRSKEIFEFSLIHSEYVNKELEQKVLSVRSIRELITMIEKDEITCVQILRVYALRATTYSLPLNHIADIDLQNAFKEALEKDEKKKEIMEKNGGRLPYLYGIPIAVKDHITAKNMLCTMALQSRLADQIDGKIHEHDFQKVWKNTHKKNLPHQNESLPDEEENKSSDDSQMDEQFYNEEIFQKEDELHVVSSHLVSKYGYEDSEIVRILRRMGAIVMCMTNTPVFCGHYITDNAVFGFSQNPYQNGRTTGGSSGGSGGIVATRSVPLAIGSDLLGSTRMPSGWCGLYGFNPTSRRISKSGAQGFELRYDCDVAKSIMPIFGPMGKCVDDLVDCMRGLFGNFTQDKQCVPMKFDEEMLKNKGKKIRFGIVKKDEALGYGNFNKNLIDECQRALTKQGYEVVEFELTEQFWHMEQISKKLFLGSQEKHMMLNELRGEKSILGIELGIIGNELPDTFKHIAKSMLSLAGEEIVAQTLDCLDEVNGRGYDKLMREREILRKKFYSYWQHQEIDALILPISYVWAPRKNEQAFVGIRFHGCLTNCLELPCGTIPIRYATEKDEGFSFNLSEKNRLLKSLIAKNLKGISGMPIGLQVACLPFEDEKCLASMKILENIFNFYPYAS